MNRLLQRTRQGLQVGVAMMLSIMIPALSWANITNTATVTYSDAAANNYSGQSLAVNTTTPPVITGAATAGGSLGVAFTPYTITASNSPTGFSQAGLPGGLTLSSITGVISGTPTAAGTFPVTLTASNAAGPSAPFTLTITIQGSPNVQLNKTSDRPTATSGTIITYTIAYQNTGTGDATNVVIKDVVPTGTTLVAGSITAGGIFSAGTITWNIGTVNVGAASASVTFKVTVN